MNAAFIYLFMNFHILETFSMFIHSNITVKQMIIVEKKLHDMKTLILQNISSKKNIHHQNAQKLP